MKKIALAAVVLSLSVCSFAQVATDDVAQKLMSKKASQDLAAIASVKNQTADKKNTKFVESFNAKIIADMKLVAASIVGNKAEFDAALKNGANINAVTADGNSIVMILTVNGHFDLLKYAVNVKGAKANKANKKGVKPYDAAQSLKRYDMAAFLQKASSTMTKQDIEMLEALQQSL